MNIDISDEMIKQIDKIKNELADIGKELRTKFDKYKAETEEIWNTKSDL